MRHLIILMAFICLNSVSAAELHPNVNRQLNDDLTAGKFIGAVVLVVNGEQQQFYSYGQKSTSDTTKPDRDTQFEIGSISKVFTTTLLAKQVTQSNIRLDTTIAEVLGDKATLKPAIANMTMLQLATHQSGLPRLPSNLKFEDLSNPYAHYGFDDMLAYLESIDADDLDGIPQYSNLGVGLLGQCLAINAGTTYVELLQKEMFNTLNMADSSIGNVSDNAAEGHTNGTSTPYWDLNAHNPAGAIISTIDDMKKFMMSYLKPDAATKLTLESQHMQTDNDGIALGWQIKLNEQHQPIYWHNGGTGGFRSMLAFNPATDEGIIILVNESNYDPTRIAVTHLMSEAKQFQEIGIDPKLFGEYHGRYELAPNIFFTITSNASNLIVQLTGQSAYEVYPYASDQFFYKVVDAQLKFQRGDDGQINGLILNQGEAQLAKKVD